MKLDIGCGAFKKDLSWIGIDVYPLDGVNAAAQMWALPFPDESVEEIYSSHALEHIPKAMVPKTFLEWHRVLVWGGQIEVRVPDLLWVCRNFIQNPRPDWNMDAVFGNQAHEGEFHKTGFTMPILINYVLEAGFEVLESSVVFSHQQDTLLVKARKSPFPGLKRV